MRITRPNMRCSEPGESLAAPQLLRSNVWAIVPLVMKGPTTVFLHRGLSPHQSTPMSGAHQASAVDGGIPVPTDAGRARPAAPDSRSFGPGLHAYESETLSAVRR